MWCPNCKREYSGGETVCADCGVPLVEMLVSVRPPEPELEFLLYIADRAELEEAMDLLEEAEIPFQCRSRGGSGYRRMTRGQGGGALYVDSRYTHRALRLLRRFDEDYRQPFGDEELDAAIADYEADFGAASPEEAEPAPTEGYRMVFVFLGLFAALVAAAALAAVLG